MLEMDSIETIELIQDNLDNKHIYTMVIAKVQDLPHRNWTVHVQHIYREVNRAADYLVATSHSLSLRLCLDGGKKMEGRKLRGKK